MTLPETNRLSPALLFENDDGLDQCGTVLVILNQPISNFNVFEQLWRHARFRICADGGANRLYDLLNGMSTARTEDYLPDAVHGDLDSLRADVRDYYIAHGVAVSKDADQESTDFGKAMQMVARRQPSIRQQDIIISGGLGGRVDQGLGLLHEIFREESRNARIRLWLVSESSVSFTLKPGRNMLQGLASTGLFTRNVGIVPIYGRAVITTSGLGWDVQDWDTQMGTQVSTSNHVVSDDVVIETNAPVLFTIELDLAELAKRRASSEGRV
ncbi:thiamine pyrophosphokinase [Sporormia fimetaria CBS 119925]|uniref:Thiamine pyrophosphokinase n=1 Tax=Sporormia fimetaria CBS 119925 TaxID=1340428 RepID=A0A6A6V3H3_9PLEO|nr:thiamine pyrophosphokinase [Sporormia fimetaria CBS 119925]